ncbi:MAG: pyrroline-5-carboxylate reductase [Thaumarchaeota archaeon]|nr:MAG: pyrroline-5-carboxylate reductase [Nitrososphaerota archaeon]
MEGEPALASLKIGIIGLGKVGEALVSGLLKAGKASPETLYLCEIDEERKRVLREAYGVTFVEAREAARKSDLLIVAVQPRNVGPVVSEVGRFLPQRGILVSTAAGVSLNYIDKYLEREDVQLFRVMPNINMMVGEAAVALASSGRVSESALKTVIDVFSSVGRVFLVEEYFMDAVTGLSGSGPAYVYLVIEALAEGGVKAGLPWELSLQLAAQTVLGSGKMVLEKRMHPAELRRLVETPGGTTIQGIMELEEGRVRAAFMRAVEKAARRAREILMD